MYTTKKQHRSSNASALLAKAYAFHTSLERTTTDIALFSKRLSSRVWILASHISHIVKALHNSSSCALFKYINVVLHVSK
jgi:hypothetical protein